MKRWKETIDRTNGYKVTGKDGKEVEIPSNHEASVQQKMATDAKEFLHQLPVKEINANPNLKQNP